MKVSQGETAAEAKREEAVAMSEKQAQDATDGTCGGLADGDLVCWQEGTAVDHVESQAVGCDEL